MEDPGIRSLLSDQAAPILINLLLLSGVLIVIGGIVIVMFRAASQGRILEAGLGIILAIVGGIALIRWLPQEILRSAVVSVRESRGAANDLNAEINAWLWARPGEIYLSDSPAATPLPVVPLEPTFHAAAEEVYPPTPQPTIVFLPTPTPAIPTPVPTVSSGPSPPALPTPGLVTRSP